MKKSILITGINGFLGGYLVNALKTQFNIYGMAKKREIKDGLTIFSSEELEEIVFIPDYIIICHAIISSGQLQSDMDSLYDVNVKITNRIIEKFTKSSIIYISSVSIYDEENFVIDEESCSNPKTNYSISKYWGEKIVQQNSNSVIIRLSSIFGVGMKEHTIIPLYINQAILQGEISVWGNGERMQNYIPVEEVVEIIQSILTNFTSVRGSLLLATHSKEYSNAQIANIISQATNAKVIYTGDDKSKSRNFNNTFTQNKLNVNSAMTMESAINKYIKWKKKQF
jgi:nucleoside-diphosphate-sugar epimerase